MWRNTWSCALDPTNRSWGCLTTQAQRAAYAAAGYLRAVTPLLLGISTDVAGALNTFFGTSADAFTGYFTCPAY